MFSGATIPQRRDFRRSTYYSEVYTVYRCVYLYIIIAQYVDQLLTICFARVSRGATRRRLAMVGWASQTHRMLTVILRFRQNVLGILFHDEIDKSSPNLLKAPSGKDGIASNPCDRTLS